MKRLQTKVTPAQNGMRLDIAVAALLPDLSRRKVRAIIDAGGVYVNGKRLRIASRSVSNGDKLEVTFDLESLKKIKIIQFEFKDEDILLDHEDFFVVNKPPGLPSQETRDQSVLHVVPCLKKYLEKKQIKVSKLVLVHRLDKETSGAIMVAKSTEAGTQLSELFKSRDIHKTYEALTVGAPRNPTFEVVNYLSDIDKRTGQVEAVRSGGKRAVTSFKVKRVWENEGLGWMECFPETGRSHQIRVHLADSGVPILGDKRYCRQKIKTQIDLIHKLSQEHQMLHARRLQFNFKGKAVDVTAPYPNNFKLIVDALGK